MPLSRTGKPWWQSRTIIAGVIEIALAVIALLESRPWATGNVEIAEALLLTAGILTILLRVMTREPVKTLPAEVR